MTSIMSKRLIMSEKKINKSIPLSVPCLKGNELKYITECIQTGWVSSVGSFVTRFERELASYVGSKYSAAVCNGTAALHLSLLVAGVKPGDEVFVPTLTFIAPVNVVKYCNAAPVFIDCDDHLNISAESLKKFITKNCIFKNKKLINKKTNKHISAIIPVHIFGHPVDMDAIMAVAEENNLKVIEDATESLGSSYNKGRYNGKKTGTIGHLGCYSFNGNKIITTGGGGMIVSDDVEVIAKAKYLSMQAKDDPAFYVHNNIGYNYRMTNLLAAIGCAQLEKLDDYIKTKRNNFDAYRKLLNGVSGLSMITEPEYAFSNYWFYSLLIDKKKYKFSNIELLQKLKECKIESRMIWHLNHKQAPYKNCEKALIKKAGYYFDNILNIPCSVDLRKKDITYISDKIKGVFFGD